MYVFSTSSILRPAIDNLISIYSEHGSKNQKGRCPVGRNRYPSRKYSGSRYVFDSLRRGKDYLSQSANFVTLLLVGQL